MKKKNIKETGITLVALVVTIIVLLILAGITISMAISNNGLIQRAKDASETYAQAEEDERKQISQFAEDIDELTGKTALSEDKIKAVNDRVKDPTKELKEVEYVAKEVTDDATSVKGRGRKVVVDGAYSGAGSNQEFYQWNIGSIGTNKLRWYVLSADEKGVNLVSEPTKQGVKFEDSPGYDNCLYYLNELSTKLFANEDYGVTEDRIHALNLTDIKTVAEQVNAGYKVTDNGAERDWSWDLDVVKASSSDVYNNGSVGQKTYTPSNKYYPGIYTADANKKVVANNPMYDEIPGSLITTDTGITREADGSNPASELTVNYTYFDTYGGTDILAKLGKFGESNIGQHLFDGKYFSYWLACRCIYAFPGGAGFSLRRVGYYRYRYDEICWSGGDTFGETYPFRVLISVPASYVDIAEDGTVTLKAKNS